MDLKTLIKILKEAHRNLHQLSVCYVLENKRFALHVQPKTRNNCIVVFQNSMTFVCVKVVLYIL